MPMDKEPQHGPSFLDFFQKQRKQKNRGEKTMNEIYKIGIDEQRKQIKEVGQMIKHKEKKLSNLKKAQNYSGQRKEESSIFEETERDLKAQKISLETEIRNQKWRLTKLMEALEKVAGELYDAD